MMGLTKAIIILMVFMVHLFGAASGFCYWSNPLFTYPSPDPWITYHNGFYYYSRSVGEGIHIHKSSMLSNWANAVEKSVWSAPKGTNHSHEVWAPELHFLHGKWYIYFAADGGSNVNHRMYVLESETDDAHGKYKFMGQLSAKEDLWSIDGTVMSYQSKLYFVWSGWDHPNAGFPQNLYIAEMESPVKINSSRVLIGVPEFDWEKKGFGPHDARGLLEGPEVLISPKGKYFITYSASSSWSEFYKIGALQLTGDNPMNPHHWRHHPKPLFGENESTNVYGTGHASFVMSKDNKEYYIVYHAMSQSNGGWVGRTARMQQFHWNETTGFPDFGIPVPLNTVFPSPGGECK